MPAWRGGRAVRRVHGGTTTRRRRGAELMDRLRLDLQNQDDKQHDDEQEEEEEEEEEEGVVEREWERGVLRQVSALKARLAELRSLQGRLEKENQSLRQQAGEMEGQRKAKRARLGLFVLEVTGLPDVCCKGALVPPFHICLRPRDASAREAPMAALPSWREKGELRVGVRLVVSDAQGQALSVQQRADVLGDLGDAEIPLVDETGDGRLVACVDDCRFLAVSGQWGGSFQIHAELVQPSVVDAAQVSLAPPHSMRVITKPRKEAKDPSECDLDDPLALIKGIGPTYAQKLADLGFSTVRSILAFPVPTPQNKSSQLAFQEHVDQLRKSRGKSKSDWETLVRQLQARARALLREEQSRPSRRRAW